MKAETRNENKCKKMQKEIACKNRNQNHERKWEP